MQVNRNKLVASINNFIKSKRKEVEVSLKAEADYQDKLKDFNAAEKNFALSAAQANKADIEICWSGRFRRENTTEITIHFSVPTKSLPAILRNEPERPPKAEAIREKIADAEKHLNLIEMLEVRNGYVNINTKPVIESIQPYLNF
jgi:hypothetical protein